MKKDSSDDANSLELTAQTAELFKFIKNQKEPSEAPAPPPELKENQQIQLISFLQKITGEPNVKKIEAVFPHERSRHHTKASEYYYNIVGNLKIDDQECIAFLQHVYKNAEEISELAIDPSVEGLATGPRSSEPPWPSQHSKAEKKRLHALLDQKTMEYSDVSHAWTADTEIQLRAYIDNWPYADNWLEDTNNEFLKRDPNAWEKWIERLIARDIESPATVARRNQNQNPLSTPYKEKHRWQGLREQRVREIISSIVEKMLKDENGKKELCN